MSFSNKPTAPSNTNMASHTQTTKGIEEINPTLLSLPRELRQAILLQTYTQGPHHGSCILAFSQSLHQNKTGIRTLVAIRLLCFRNDISRWANDLRQVHPSLAKDMDFVEKKWAVALKVSIDELRGQHQNLILPW